MNNLLAYFTGQDTNPPEPDSSGDPRMQVLQDIVARKQRRYAPQADIYADQRVPGLGLGEGNVVDIANMSPSTRKSAVAAVPDIITTPGKIAGTLKDVGSAAVGKLSGNKKPFLEQMAESAANAGPIRRYNQQLSDTINEELGAPKDEDKSLPDQLAAGAFQSLVPVPAIPGGTNVLTKTLSHGGNALIPGSSSMLGAAGNVGIGGTITAGIDQLINPNQTDIRTPPPQVSSNVPDDADTHELPMSLKTSAASDMVPAVAILGAFMFGGAAGARATAKAAVKSFDTAGAAHVPAEAAHGAGRVSRAVDELAPVQSMLQRAAAGGEKPVMQRVLSKEGRVAYNIGADQTNAVTIDYRSNINAAIDDLRTTGHIEGLDKPTVPLNIIKAQIDKLDQAGLAEQYDVYRRSLTVKDTRSAALSSRQTRLNDINVEQQAAIAKKNHAKYNELDNERIKIQEETDKLIADDPTMRNALTGWDNQQLDKHIYEGRQVPEFKEVDKVIKKFTDDLLEAQVRAGVLSRDKANAFLKDNPNWTPMIDDPMYGKTSVDRIWGVAKKRFGLTENPEVDKPYGKQVDASLARSIDTEDAINRPRSVHESLDLHADRVMRFISHERFKQNVLDDLESSAKANGLSESSEFERYKGPRLMTTEQVKALPQHADISKFTSIMRDGKVELVKFKDPSVTATLNFAPQVSIPMVRSLTQTFKTATTGLLRPAFAMKSFVFDNFGVMLARGHESRFGTDFALEQLFRHQMPDTLSGFIRTVATGVGDPIAQTISVGTAITSFIRQNQVMLARNITEGLARQQGFFSVLAKAPGGEQALNRLANIAVESFEKSYYGMLTHQRVTGASAIENMTKHIRETDQFITAKLGPVSRFAISPIVGAMQQYKMMLSSMHGAGRTSYAMQQLFTEALHRGVKVADLPDSVVSKIATDARTMVGDFSRKGGKEVQYTDSAVPYFNVMLRTSQAIHQRMLRGDPLIGVMGFTSTVMPGIMTAYIMSNSGRDLYNQYWRDLPEFEREGNNYIPNVQTVWDWAHGRNPKLTLEKNFNKVSRIPEFMPHTSMTVNGLRALGMFGPGNRDIVNPGNTHNMMKAFGEAMAQAFAPIVPPALTGLAKAGGANLDLGNVYKGDWPISPDKFSVSGRGGGYTPTASPGSMIPKPLGDIIGGMGGVFGRQMITAVDTGAYSLKHANPDDGNITKVAKAVYAGGKDLVQSMTDTRTDVQAPLMPHATERIYKGTSSAEYGQTMRNTMKLAAGRNSLGKVGIPEIDGISHQIAAYARVNSEYKITTKTYMKLADDLKNIDRNRSVPYSERMNLRNGVLKQMNANNSTQNALYSKIEKQIAASPLGQAFQQRFGKVFSFDTYSKEYQNAKANK